MSAASELIERLRRHYIRDEAQPGGVFVAECGLNNGFGDQRRVDALHIGFTGTSGRILRGHEVKVSRADWLHELAQPDKASVWLDACHEWWLVTPVPDMVRLGELPPGWGHMVPDPRARVRFKIVTEAARKSPTAHDPSWLVMRSIIARMDTVTHARRREDSQQLRDEIRAEILKQQQAAQERVLTLEQRTKIETFDELAKLLGPDQSVWQAHYDLVAAAKLAPNLERLLGSRYGGESLGQAAAALQALAGNLQATQDALDQIRAGR